VLGKEAPITTTATETVFSWTPVGLYETLPSFGLESKEGDLLMKYTGLKVDRFELAWELDEDVVITMDLIGRDSDRIDTISEKFAFETDVYPIIFEQGTLTAEEDDVALTIGGLRSCTVRIINNLERRPALDGTRLIADLKPRRIEVEAEFTVDDIDTIKNLIDAVHDRKKIDLKLSYSAKIKNYDTTINLILENAWGQELRDTIRGLDIYEIPIPCRFIGVPGTPAIQVEQRVATTNTTEALKTLIF